MNKIPCGKTIGHGEYCCEGWLCGACESARSQETLLKESYSTLLWLYRRLPRGYANPPHVDIVVRKLAKEIGTDCEEFIAERSENY